MAGITLCYQKISSDYAHKLKDALENHFGAGKLSDPVVLDDVGSGIIEKNQRRMVSSDVLLILIDENWVSPHSDDMWYTVPHNPVRLLLADALIREVRLIPVLIKGGTLPKEEDLPLNLRSLIRRQAFSIESKSWKHDFTYLLNKLAMVVSPEQEKAVASPVILTRSKRNSTLSRIKDLSSRILGSFKRDSPSSTSRNKVQKRQERGGSGHESKAFKPQEVHLAASAPPAIQPGTEFTARFAAYIKEAEAHVEELFEKLSPRSVSQMDIKRCQWQPGTRVTVALSGRWLEVEETEQTFVWEGPHTIIDFDVFLDPEAPLGNTILKFNVSIDGIRVSKLRMDLAISETSDPGKSATVTAEANRTAFASYSSNDRQRVLDRLASVRISAGLEIFLDCLSLRPGEEWKPRLAKEIRTRDQFLLFWSQSAADSKWVTWEWQTALDEKGKPKMQIHLLENNVPAPEQLNDLHFGDVFITLKDAET